MQIKLIFIVLIRDKLSHKDNVNQVCKKNNKLTKTLSSSIFSSSPLNPADCTILKQ